MDHTAKSAQAALLQMAAGKSISMALAVAAKLGVADLLHDGPLSASKMAVELQADGDALYRMLRTLAVMGVFDELPGRRFANNAMSKPLRSDTPGSLRALIDWMGEEAGWQAWGYFSKSISDGGSAFEATHGMPSWDYYADRPKTAHAFQAAMTCGSAITGEAILKAYNFGEFSSIVDVGGGYGELLRRILAETEGVSGILFDRPEVIAQAPARTENIQSIGGDFFEEIPADAELYLLKHVIHDWDDDHCTAILQNCRRAMSAEGRILVIEQPIMNEPDGSYAAMMDLEMMVYTIGGQERTIEEYSGLFAQSGLRLNRLIETESPFADILEAVSS